MKIKGDFRKYHQELEDKIKVDPSRIFSYLRTRKGDRAGNKVLNYENNKYSGSTEISQIFAKYFKSVYSQNPSVYNINNICSSPIGPNSDILTVTEIDVDEVVAAIRKMKPKKSSGPDEIPPYLVKGMCDVLCGPLTIIFNRCLKSNLYPNVWKVSKVCPVPKKPMATNVEDFRPVAIGCVFAKIFESVLKSYL